MDIKTARYEDYSLFYKFFLTYSEKDFKRINPNDPLMQELDSYMDYNRQLFYITDVIQLDIKFISKGVKSMFGLDPDKITTGFFLTTTHPEDLKRHRLARSKLISVAEELYIRKVAPRSSPLISGEEYQGAMNMQIISINVLSSTVKFPTNRHFLYL